MIKQLLPIGFLTATALLLITACSEQGSDQAANAEVASNQLLILGIGFTFILVNNLITDHQLKTQIKK